MSYNIKYREQALKCLEMHSYKETAEIFGVSINALVTWKKKLEKTGSLEDAPRKQRIGKICPEALVRYVEKHPDKYSRTSIVK